VGAQELGGQDIQSGNRNPVGSVRIYDIATDAWTAGAEANRNRVFSDAPVRAGQVVRVLGQQRYSGVLAQDEIQSYNIGDDTWAERGAWPTNRNRRGAPTLNLSAS